MTAHDDRLAEHLEQLHRQHKPVTTAEVNDKADRIIRDFESFRASVARWVIAFAAVLIVLGAGVIAAVIGR